VASTRHDNEHDRRAAAVKLVPPECPRHSGSGRSHCEHGAVGAALGAVGVKHGVLGVKHGVLGVTGALARKCEPRRAWIDRDMAYFYMIHDDEL
jgi:hypothetical protein